MRESSQVGEARRHAAALAERVGLDPVAAGRLSLVVNELGNNLVRHAVEGRLLIGRCETDAGDGVELLSLDGGPGMADVERCMADGFSSAGTPGTGLGAVRRLSNQFEAFSQVGSGSVILARLCNGAPDAGVAHRTPTAFGHGAVCTAAPGETVSGDGWSLRIDGRQVALMVADGLGHGPDAAAAADTAIGVFEQQAFGAPEATLDRAHAVMRSTRGAAVAIALLDLDAGQLVFCGAGNIAGRIISGVSDRTLMSQHGTVGMQIRRPQTVAYPWPEHALLVMHSDGIVSRWNLHSVPGLLLCSPTLIAAWLIGAHARGRDDATVVVVREA